MRGDCLNHAELVAKRDQSRCSDTYVPLADGNLARQVRTVKQPGDRSVAAAHTCVRHLTFLSSRPSEAVGAPPPAEWLLGTGYIDGYTGQCALKKAHDYR